MGAVLEQTEIARCVSWVNVVTSVKTTPCFASGRVSERVKLRMFLYNKPSYKRVRVRVRAQKRNARNFFN